MALTQLQNFPPSFHQMSVFHSLCLKLFCSAIFNQWAHMKIHTHVSTLWFHIFTINQFSAAILSHCVPVVWIKCVAFQSWDGHSCHCTTRPLFVSSADGTFKMLMPEMYCRALQKYFKVRRKEAKGTDAEQVLKEVRDGVKRHQN